MGCVSSKNETDGRAAPAEPVKGNAPDGAPPGGQTQQPQLDARLPFSNYRDVYSLKNYWKSVRRKETFGKCVLLRFLKDFPDHKAKFQLLSQSNLSDESKLFENTEFEQVALTYFQVFDEAMSEVENNPGNMDTCIGNLIAVGKKYKNNKEYTLASFQAIEEPFLGNVRDVLEDRYNEKCETLFRSFFKFCLKHIEQGFNE